MAKVKSSAARDLLAVADELVKKSVWILGGDGWGYDIGYGGLDHVLASTANVNILLLDTEVYSNTGGQMSKAALTLNFDCQVRRQRQASLPRKISPWRPSITRMLMSRMSSMGGSDSQTMKAFLEAEAYGRPSLIIAYSRCIAHQLRHGVWHRAAEKRGELRTLATVPLQPGPGGGRKKSLPA